MPTLGWIIIGAIVIFVIGFYFGMFIMSMLAISASADRAAERMRRNK